MKIETASVLAAALCAAAFADPYGAPPDAMHAWAVHDDFRPLPKKVAVGENGIPSDAKLLFDGSRESVEANWCDSKGNPTKWRVDPDGTFVSVAGAGYVFTKDAFADCQLHVEWASPVNVDPKLKGQARGNSGVFLMGNFEVQVLDSYETDPDAPGGNKNPNYADGQAGAVYGQNPPAVNPCRAPGEFNTYDIVFHPPVFDAAGALAEPAQITVFFNGVLVQDGWKFDGPTGFRKRAEYARWRSDTGLKRADRMPIAFQDHGNPVRYRNVWVREIPRPSANTVHGVYYAKPGDAADLRRKTAAELDAKWNELWAHIPVGRRLAAAWRIAVYSPTPARMGRVDAIEKEFLEAVKGAASAGEVLKLTGIGHADLRDYLKRVKDAGFFDEDPVLTRLLELK